MNLLLNAVKTLRTRKGIWMPLMAALLIAPRVTHAFTLFSVGDILSKAVIYPIYVVGWIVSLIGGVFVVLAAYLVQFILIVNMQIVQSPVVALGYPVTLSIANLLFVLGLIIIAVATILQLQSYGMKQALWKLMVIAIAVNFGLVIAGTILRVSDSITMYMVQSINPSGNTAGESWGAMKEFASTLAGAFNPQKVFNASPDLGTLSKEEITTSAAAFSLSAPVAQNLLKPILGVILSALTLAIIIICLLTLAIMLMIRYVKLILLLIMLPLKWAMWPFPLYSSKFTKWWTDFTKHAFSPIPIVFSLWLTVIVLQRMSQADSSNFSIMGLDMSGQGQNSLAAGLLGLLGGLAMPLADNLLRMAFVGGIMMAGLAGSAAMGAEFAKTAERAVHAGGKAMRQNLVRRANNTRQRAQSWVSEKTMPKLLKLKQGAQRLNEFNLSGKGRKGIEKVSTENVLRDEHGNLQLSEVATNAAGKHGVHGDIVTDAAGKQYADFQTNTDVTGVTQYIDSKTGKVIVGAKNPTQAYITRDGEIFDVASATDRRLAYATDQRSVAEDMNEVRNGKVAVDESGNIVKAEEVLTIQGNLKNTFVDKDGKGLSDAEAMKRSGQILTKKKLEEVTEKVESGGFKAEREKLWLAQELGDSLLKDLTYGPLSASFKKMLESHGSLELKDLTKFLEQRGVHVHGDEHGGGGGGPAPAGGGGGAPGAHT